MKINKQYGDKKKRFFSQMVFKKRENLKKITKKIVKINEIVNLAKEIIKLRSFEEKEIWFKFNMETLRIPWIQGSDPIMITKENIIDDTLNFIDLCDMHKVFYYFLIFIYF